MKSVIVTVSQLTKLFSILSCKWSRWNFVPSLLWFEFGQLNSSCSIFIGFLCAAAFSSFFWVCKSDIYFCNTKEQFGCPIIQSFFPWPPFPPSDSYPAGCVCTKTHAHPFFWLIGSDSEALCLTKIWYTETQSFRSSQYHRADHLAIVMCSPTSYV